jgi:hypothetical protein
MTSETKSSIDMTITTTTGKLARDKLKELLGHESYFEPFRVSANVYSIQAEKFSVQAEKFSVQANGTPKVSEFDSITGKHKRSVLDSDIGIVFFYTMETLSLRSVKDGNTKDLWFEKVYVANATQKKQHLDIFLADDIDNNYWIYKFYASTGIILIRVFQSRRGVFSYPEKQYLFPPFGEPFILGLHDFPEEFNILPIETQLEMMVQLNIDKYRKKDIQMEDQFKIILRQQYQLNDMQTIILRMQDERDMMMNQLQQQSKLISSIIEKIDNKNTEQEIIKSEVDLLLNGIE